LQDAVSQVDPTNEKKQLPRAGPASFYGITSVMYNMEEGDTTVFTPKNIKGMCETERLWMDVPAFQDYCQLIYENTTDVNSKSECASNTFSAPRMFYSTTILDCADKASRHVMYQVQADRAALIASESSNWATTNATAKALIPARVGALMAAAGVVAPTGADMATYGAKAAQQVIMEHIQYILTVLVPAAQEAQYQQKKTATSATAACTALYDGWKPVPNVTSSDPADQVLSLLPKSMALHMVAKNRVVISLVPVERFFVNLPIKRAYQSAWEDMFKIPAAQLPQSFNFSSCPDISADRVATVDEYLRTMASRSGMVVAPAPVPVLDGQDVFGFWLAKDHADKKLSTKTQSMVLLGGPINRTHTPDGRVLTDKNGAVPPSTSLAERAAYAVYANATEKALFDNFGMDGDDRLVLGFMRRSSYISPPTPKVGDSHIEWFTYIYLNNEFDRNLNGDLLVLALSILFVIIWICMHTGTLEMFFLDGVLIALVSIFQIILSLVVSGTVYRYTMGITFFSQLHILAIFVILGVGADDVFVMVDAWKQSGEDVPRRPPAADRAAFSDCCGLRNSVKKIDFYEHLIDRMEYAITRTISAVFNTSFTTAIAFVATGVSPIMSISTFGWFAATCIVVNYVFAITVTPSLVVAIDVWMRPCFPKKKAGAKPSFCQRCCGFDIVTACFKRCFVPCMKNKFAAVASLVLLGGYAAQGLYFFSQLTPPTKAEQWFPANHMFTGVQDRLTQSFVGGGDDQYVTMRTAFGLGSTDSAGVTTIVDRAGHDIYSPDNDRGAAVFDPDFDIYPDGTQKAIVDFCDKLSTKVCTDPQDATKYLVGCSNKDHTLLRSGTLVCFMKEFQLWHKDKYANALPNAAAGVTKDQFYDRLLTFRNDPSNKPAALGAYGSWKNFIGVVDGKLKFAQVQFTSSMIKLQPIEVKRPLKKMLDQMATDYQDAAPKTPSGAKQKIFHDSGQQGWVWMMTEEALVSGLFTGLAIGFPVSFLILVLSTRNILISLFAVVNIVCIVGCVLGWCRSVMGWDLGVAESIAGIIVIGLAVDYVVHMAHMYVDSAHQDPIKYHTRVARFEYAATKMGGTVLAGAITTAGSGAFMWVCTLTFFSKMANLICMTIIFSFAYAIFFFLPLLRLFGPEGHTADIGYMFGCIKDEPRRVAGTTVEMSDKAPPPSPKVMREVEVVAGAPLSDGDHL
jgi:predicted RND superfamily exporter protein